MANISSNSMQVKECNHCKDKLETDVYVVDLMKKSLPPYVVAKLLTD